MNLPIRFSRLDAAQSAWLIEQTRFIEAKVLETPIGPFKAATLIPTEPVPRGASSWAYYRVTSYGMARWLAANARDLPRANVERKRYDFPIRAMGLSYGWTLEDVLASQMAGVALDDAEARATRRGIDAFIDQTWLRGDAAIGFEGFINNPNIPAGNVVNGGWLAGATPDAILKDLHTEAQAIETTTREVYKPDTIVLPPDQYAHIHTVPRTAQSDTTIAEFFLRTTPTIRRIEKLEALKGAGVGGTDRMLTYLKDPEVIVAKVAIPYETLPLQEQGLEYVINAWARIGGVAVRTPIAAKYGDGI